MAAVMSAAPSHAYESLKQRFSTQRLRWCVTGVAGFIGSNLLEALLRHGQDVVGLDNFSTGHRHNLEQVRHAVGAASWARFRMIEGDIGDPGTCARACHGAQYVLHQAALGSVPRSIADPRSTHAANVDGFLNMLLAARDAGVGRFVYASSSSVYGDHSELPKVEERVGKLLSPYAVSKAINEMYAEVFGRCYGMATIGLRYFNVFGPRQDPRGAYAAVIPRWIAALIEGRPVTIFGDGETSRDFCYVDNVVQMNLLSALTDNEAACNRAYNVAVGDRLTLNELFYTCRDLLAERFERVRASQLQYSEFRAGDVRHSQADISAAESLVGYRPTHHVEDGLREAMDWYVAHLTADAGAIVCSE